MLLNLIPIGDEISRYLYTTTMSLNKLILASRQVFIAQIGQNLTRESNMVHRKILDNFKGFKIENPVYRILTLLGKFRRRAQIYISVLLPNFTTDLFV